MHISTNGWLVVINVGAGPDWLVTNFRNQPRGLIFVESVHSI